MRPPEPARIGRNKTYSSEQANPWGADTVFDIGANGRRNYDEVHGRQYVYGHFRNRGDEPDGKPVTARLLGDPNPNRVVPKIPDEEIRGYRPAPIHLTFREMRAAYGEN